MNCRLGNNSEMDCNLGNKINVIAKYIATAVNVKMNYKLGKSHLANPPRQYVTKT